MNDKHTGAKQGEKQDEYTEVGYWHKGDSAGIDGKHGAEKPPS